jgi:ferrous iron transport protein A
MLEMGLTPGVEIAFLGTSLLGDPIEVQVRGYRLSLRKLEALKVKVDLTSVDPV